MLANQLNNKVSVILMVKPSIPNMPSFLIDSGSNSSTDEDIWIPTLSQCKLLELSILILLDSDSLLNFI